MKRSIIVLIILLFSGSASYSQTHVSGILNSGIIKPTNSIFDAGFAFNGTIFTGISDHIDLTISAGYISWRSSDRPTNHDRTRINVYPLYFGGRYYALKRKVSPYFGSEVGINIITHGPRASLVKSLGYDLSIGALYSVANGIQLDIGTEFSSIQNSDRLFLLSDSDSLDFFTLLHIGLIFSLE